LIMASSWFGKMLGKALTLGNLDDLLVMQMQDLYSAESQLILALPKMANAASSSRLKTAFEAHLQDTIQHKARLEKMFKGLGVEPGSDKCEAMAGLISEGQEIINTLGEPDVKDSALIAAAQRVEHYEIAGYGCARAFARHLGKSEIVSQLQETLRNEVETDQLLTEIAEGATNPAAAHVAEK
jgi:ferritin-like metal-binding protein YciE